MGFIGSGKVVGAIVLQYGMLYELIISHYAFFRTSRPLYDPTHQHPYIPTIRPLQSNRPTSPMPSHAFPCLPIQIAQSPFSALNPSHASFSVANTAALIIFCSVVAVVGNCVLRQRISISQTYTPRTRSLSKQTEN